MINQLIQRIFIFGFLIAFVAGCGSEHGGQPTSLPESSTPPSTPAIPTITATPNIQLLDIQKAWGKSPHAQAADEVTCNVCHQVQNGAVTEEIVRWDQNNPQNESVSDYNELCANCHEEYDHAEATHKNLLCLDCHDPHSTSAECFDCHPQIIDLTGKVPSTPVGGHSNGTDDACSGSGCHSSATQVAKMPFSIHGIQHARVTCSACHDADGLQVGPLPDGSAWVSWSYSKDNGSEIPFSSHNLQYHVECQRCHYKNNPWELPTDGIQTDR